MISLPRWVRIGILTVLYVFIIVLAISLVKDTITIIEMKIPLVITDPYEQFLFQQLYAAGLTYCTIDICYSILKSYPSKKRQLL